MGGRGRSARPADPPPAWQSDPIDAEAAARAVLAGTATATPKRREGIIEAIRVLRTARRGASKARTAAINQLKALLVTAPAPVREALDDLSASALVTTCARFRPDEAGLGDPLYASKAALQAIARRIQLLEAKLELADRRLATLVGRAEGEPGRPPSRRRLRRRAGPCPPEPRPEGEIEWMRPAGWSVRSGAPGFGRGR